MRSWLCGVVALALLACACVSKLPVVTNPAYPEYLFPPVPADYAGSDVARGHGDAWTYLQAGDIATAQTRYTELLEEDPEFYPATVALGWIGIAQDEHDVAAELFSEVTVAEPGYVSALVGHGEAMLALERPNSALESFERALATEPRLSNLVRVVAELRFTVVSAQVTVARRAAEAGQFNEAIDAYQQVIAASPESGFLHVEVGRVERRRGDLSAALEHAHQAERLDPQDPEGFILEGEIHEANGDLESALSAYQRANSIVRTDEVTRNINRMRDRIFAAGLPTEVDEIQSKASVTRGDLAVLIALRFDDILAVSGGQAVIITDTRNHWGHQWIQVVADAKIMDVDAAYRFNPSGLVRRSELSEVIISTLDLSESQGVGNVLLGEVGMRSFSDMSSTHLSYESARRAVAIDVLDVLENDEFQPSVLVTGAGAVEAVDRLAELVFELQ